MISHKVVGEISDNGSQLGEVADLEALTFIFALMVI